MADARAWVDRLVAATNAHDLEALVGCFAEDYRNITPSHPGRGFTGREQVRRNWEQIFASVPDLRADVVASTVDGSTVWTQWDMRGTRADGSAHRMAGVIIFDVTGDVAQAATFFLEPVDAGADSVDQAVRAQVVR
jgi:ketosteroid isomerase-like protein